MKSSAWDNKLWQNKMQEIPLERDADLAWTEMQGLLDDVMPVSPTAPVIKKPWILPKTMLLTIAYTAAAAAIIVFATHFLLKNNHHKPIKHNKEHIKPIHDRADSTKQPEHTSDSIINARPVAGHVVVDSLNIDDPSAKNKSNTANVNDKANAGNENGKRAVGDTVKSSSKKQTSSLLSGSTTTPVSAKNKNGNSVAKGRNGIPNGTTQTKNIATLPAAATGHNAAVNRHARSGRNMGVNSSGFNSTGTISHTNNGHQSVDKNMLADESASKTNGLIKPNGSSLAQKGGHPASTVPVGKPSKADSSKTTGNKLTPVLTPNTATVNNTSTVSNTASIKNKSLPKTTAKNAKQQTYSKFDIAIEAGINAGKGSTRPFAGLSGSYTINSKFSVGIGANLFSSRNIAGTYNISKYNYTTQDDSGHTTKRTAQNLLVSTSQKINTLEIPLTATYKLTKWLSVKGGPVISIPIKTGVIQNTLAPVGTTLDTARAFKTLSSAVNSTAILNTVNLNITGGVLINMNRIYFDAGYVQGVGPYKINSSLGSGNVYYHYLQLGVGYKLFKSKPKNK